MLKINAGSGQRKFAPPWINVDCQPKWEPDHVCNVEAMPFADHSAELIVSHHCIEHMGCGEADGFIKEARRLLCPRGSLLIFVPNIRELARAFLMGKIDEYIFNANMYGAYMGDEADRHRWGYSLDGMVDYLIKTADWSEIRPFDWRQIDGADIAKDWWILGVEAIK